MREHRRRRRNSQKRWWPRRRRRRRSKRSAGGSTTRWRWSRPRPTSQRKRPKPRTLRCTRSRDRPRRRVAAACASSIARTTKRRVRPGKERGRASGRGCSSKCRRTRTGTRSSIRTANRCRRRWHRRSTPTRRRIRRHTRIRCRRSSTPTRPIRRGGKRSTSSSRNRCRSTTQRPSRCGARSPSRKAHTRATRGSSRCSRATRGSNRDPSLATPRGIRGCPATTSRHTGELFVAELARTSSALSASQGPHRRKDAAMRLMPDELFQSRISDRKGLPYGEFNQPQLVPLARVSVDTGVAQAWRVTLGRVDRVDDGAVGHPGDPGGSFSLYEGQQYQYDFWLLSNPIIPPRRASPIFDATDPANGADIRDAFVEIAWGTGDGARPNRLLAQWPVQGASIVVTGTYVEVWAGQMVGGLGTPPIPPGAFPTFQATIVQESSVATDGGGAELSLIATVVINDREGGEVNAQNHFVVSDTFLGGTLRGSAVQDVAPFAG